MSYWRDADEPPVALVLEPSEPENERPVPLLVPERDESATPVEAVRPTAAGAAEPGAGRLPALGAEFGQRARDRRPPPHASPAGRPRRRAWSTGALMLAGLGAIVLAAAVVGDRGPPPDEPRASAADAPPRRGAQPRAKPRAPAPRLDAERRQRSPERQTQTPASAERVKRAESPPQPAPAPEPQPAPAPIAPPPPTPGPGPSPASPTPAQQSQTSDFSFGS